jgi:hypothetical protein
MSTSTELKLIVMLPTGQQQEVVIPLHTKCNSTNGSFDHVEFEQPKTETIYCPSHRHRQKRGTKEFLQKREITKEFLKNKFKNSSLPLWLADLGCAFDVEDDTFFETKVKPELEKKAEKKAEKKKNSNLKTFKKTVESLRYFIMKNFPEVIHKDVFEFIRRLREDSSSLSRHEEKSLNAIEICIKRPEELQRLHKSAQKEVKKSKPDRIMLEFAKLTIFKPSFANIKIDGM